MTTAFSRRADRPIPLEDRLGINDLFTRYTCALDAGEVDTMVDCFTEWSTGA